MARRTRIDAPGTWHHVMNRGVARRSIFESDSDVCRFTDRLEIAAERCDLEIHAYTALHTHFHLLIRSRSGLLSRGLHLIQSPFALWFNRTRERDGPLHRSRFRSIEVDSLRYRHFLVRYIDTNPVDAGLASRPDEYPHGSAIHYARRGGPTWMTRDWVEDEVRLAARAQNYHPADYSTAFPPITNRELREFVEREPERTRTMARSADSLLTQTRGRWTQWLAERARNADGSSRFTTVIPLNYLNGWMTQVEIEDEPRHGNSKHSRKAQIHLAMGRLLTGATLDELARALAVSPRTVCTLWCRVRNRLGDDERFSTLLATLATRATRSFWDEL